MGMIFNMQNRGKAGIFFNTQKTYTFNNSTNKAIYFNDSYNWNGKVVLPNGITHISFINCNTFNSPVKIPDSLTNCVNMFCNCRNFNQPITTPDSVTNCSTMFYYCSNFNQPITIPDTVTNCYRMFYYCSNFNQPITIPSRVTNYIDMFEYCADLNSDIHVYCPAQNGINAFSIQCNNITDIYFHNLRTNFYGQNFRIMNNARLNIHINKTLASTGTNINVNYFMRGVKAKLKWSSGSSMVYNATYNVYIYNDLIS